MIRAATTSAGVGVPEHEDRELVAPEAGDQVAGRAALPPITPRPLLQRRSPTWCPRRVVDLLEVVEVDEEHGHGPAWRRRASETRSPNVARLGSWVSGSRWPDLLGEPPGDDVRQRGGRG